jgi:hypothetical protein
MSTPSNIIQVPKPPREAYNKDRPAGKLLRAQIVHLREALIKHLEHVAVTVAIDPRSIQSEGEASAYIERCTAILHPHAAKPGRK